MENQNWIWKQGKMKKRQKKNKVNVTEKVLKIIFDSYEKKIKSLSAT